MAENKTHRAFWEVLRDAIVALGVDFAFKEWMKKGVIIAGEKIKQELVDKDQRAELLEDFRKMPQQDTENLWRRHREAVTDLQENRFTSLLCKIPKDQTEGRRPTLKYLNDLDDERFDQALYLLEHDVALQWLKKIRREGGRIVEKDARTIRESFLKGAGSVDSGAEGLARRLSAFTDKLEGKKPKSPDSDSGESSKSGKSGGGFASTILRWRGIR